MKLSASLFLAFVCNLILIHNLSAQSEWKNWNSLNVDLSISKKTDIGVSHLRSYTITNGFNNGFNQSGIDINHDFTKKISGRAGILLNFFPGSSQTTSRYFARVSHKLTFADAIRWTNSLQVERHSNTETRYRNRFIYITRLSPRRRLDFLNLSPSISYWLYYNAGGSAVQYYDKTGMPGVQQSPNGFHRGRLYLNLNSKISDHVSVSLYYMNQKEFNFLSETNREMNVVDPNTGIVSRPFDDYNVVGCSLLLDFNLYKPKSKLKSKSSTKKDKSDSHGKEN